MSGDRNGVNSVGAVELPKRVENEVPMALDIEMRIGRTGNDAVGPCHYSQFRHGHQIDQRKLGVSLADIYDRDMARSHSI